MTQSYFECSMPEDIAGYLGISCYRPESQIEFAAEKGLKYLELRPGSAYS